MASPWKITGRAREKLRHYYSTSLGFTILGRARQFYPSRHHALHYHCKKNIAYITILCNRAYLFPPYKNIHWDSIEFDKYKEKEYLSTISAMNCQITLWGSFYGCELRQLSCLKNWSLSVGEMSTHRDNSFNKTCDIIKLFYMNQRVYWRHWSILAQP